MANFIVKPADESQIRSDGKTFVVFNVADAAAAKARAEVMAGEVAGAFGSWSTRAIATSADDFIFESRNGAVFSGGIDRGGNRRTF